VGLALQPALSEARQAAASQRLQLDDLFVRNGDAALTPLTAADITVNALAVMAWPFDPASKTVRSALRTNLVLLVRLVPASLSASTRRASVNGVVAYSALCSHASCNLASDQDLVVCDCHGSIFDPKDSGKVVEGPASRPLPILPLKIVGGALAVASAFSAPIQFDQ
jgi:Rieske Fe-S protein